MTIKEEDLLPNSEEDLSVKVIKTYLDEWVSQFPLCANYPRETYREFERLGRQIPTIEEEPLFINSISWDTKYHDTEEVPK